VPPQCVHRGWGIGQSTARHTHTRPARRPGLSPPGRAPHRTSLPAQEAAAHAAPLCCVRCGSTCCSAAKCTTRAAGLALPVVGLAGACRRLSRAHLMCSDGCGCINNRVGRTDGEDGRGPARKRHSNVGQHDSASATVCGCQCMAMLFHAHSHVQTGDLQRMRRARTPTANHRQRQQGEEDARHFGARHKRDLNLGVSDTKCLLNWSMSPIGFGGSRIPRNPLIKIRGRLPCRAGPRCRVAVLTTQLNSNSDSR
jgi:hypothetical protein